MSRCSTGDGPGNVNELATVIDTYDGTTDKEASLRLAMTEISILTTGSQSKRRKAVESLVKILESQAYSPGLLMDIHDAGGTHVLQANITSRDPEIGNACVRGLVVLCKEDKARMEISNSRDASSRVLKASLVGLLEGNMDHLQLFRSLVEQIGDRITSLCAQNKVIQRLLECIEKEDEKQAPLLALESLVRTGVEYYVESFAWHNGAPIVANILASESVPTEAKVPALQTMLSFSKFSPQNIDIFSTADCIKGLSLFLANSSFDLQAQISAAHILISVSKLKPKRAEALDSFLENCLPRVCEILHQSRTIFEDVKEQKGIEEMQQMLMKQPDGNLSILCAGILAYIAKDSEMCCHVIIFHADILQYCVSILVATKMFECATVLLDASASYSKDPSAFPV